MLPDLLRPALRAVFCGTAASSASADLGVYYGGRGNKFWSILHDTGLTPCKLSPADYVLLPEFGLGLTDIVKGQSGADRDIDFSGAGASAVRRKIELFQPVFLCFNGKKAAEEFLGLEYVDYGLRSERVGETSLYVLPSTAGNANGFWNPDEWHRLASMLGEGSS